MVRSRALLPEVWGKPAKRSETVVRLAFYSRDRTHLVRLSGLRIFCRSYHVASLSSKVVSTWIGFTKGGVSVHLR